MLRDETRRIGDFFFWIGVRWSRGVGMIHYYSLHWEASVFPTSSLALDWMYGWRKTNSVFGVAYVCIYTERERLSINLNMRAFNETWFLHPAVGCVCRLGHFPGNQEDARRVISSMGLGYSSYIVGSDPRGS